MNEFGGILKNIFDNYLSDYQGPFGSDKTSYKAFYKVQDWLKENATNNREDLNIKFSVGKGNWTQVPWFAILNSKEAKDTRNGFYIVALFQHSMEGFYLGIGQGVTGPNEKYGNKGGAEYLKEKTEEVKSEIGSLLDSSFTFTENIDLKATGGVAMGYGPGLCFQKYYNKENIPNDENILKDINNLIEVYDKILEKNISSNLSKKSHEKNSWVLSAGRNSEFWEKFQNEQIISIGWDKLGNLAKFKTKSDIAQKIKELYREEDEAEPRNQALTCYEFAKDITIGDFIYIKKGSSKLLGVCEVISDYIYDETQGLHPHIRKVKWLKIKDFDIQSELGHTIALKTLTNFTRYPDTVKKFEQFYFMQESTSKERMQDLNNLSEYERTAESQLIDTFFSHSEFIRIFNNLKDKKNIIIQGAPGVGKTFIGKKLAQCLANSETNIQSLVLHENYSYEEFIMGIRPDKDGKFILSNGVFYDFCHRAIQNPNEKFVLLLDEINRANITKIFGELLVLIENNKRGPKNAVKLIYKPEENFYVPENFYIIGLMNTADRSLKVVDYALRRRFSFYTFEPDFENPEFKNFLIKKNVNTNTVDKIIKNLSKVNQKISDDSFELGPGYCIGHSFFCPEDNKVSYENDWYENIIKNQILPLIEEYYFDKPDTIEEIREDLLS